LVAGGRWCLADQAPDRFTLVVFYRGLHCPICQRYLRQLDGMVDDFAAMGVTSVLAVSGDTEERARQAVNEWALTHLAVGHGQTVESMREWGLFVSHAIRDTEPTRFGEPGLFLIRPDGTIYTAIINSMPFARPPLDELAATIQRITDDYPARGEA
jgi:peroxiredoxin